MIPEQAIITRLLADTNVSGMVGTHVFSDLPVEDTALPAVLVQRRGAKLGRGDSAKGLTTYTVTVKCWTVLSLDCYTLAGYIRATLDGWANDATNTQLDHGEWVNESEASDEYGFALVGEYEIFWRDS